MLFGASLSLSHPGLEKAGVRENVHICWFGDAAKGQWTLLLSSPLFAVLAFSFELQILGSWSNSFFFFFAQTFYNLQCLIYFFIKTWAVDDRNVLSWCSRIIILQSRVGTVKALFCNWNVQLCYHWEGAVRTGHVYRYKWVRDSSSPVQCKRLVLSAALNHTGTLQQNAHSTIVP